MCVCVGGAGVGRVAGVQRLNVCVCWWCRSWKGCWSATLNECVCVLVVQELEGLLECND